MTENIYSTFGEYIDEVIGVGLWRYEGFVVEVDTFEEGIKVKAVENKKKGYMRIYIHRENGRYLDPVAYVTIIKP